MTSVVRFTGDTARFFVSWVSGGSDYQDVKNEAYQMLCSAERIALTILGYLALDKARDHMSLKSFTALCWTATGLAPESRLAIAAYLGVLSFKQLAAFTTQRMQKQAAPTTWALFGILHLTFMLGQARLYDEYLKKTSSDGKTLDKRSPISLGIGETINDKASEFLAYLVTGKKS